MQYRCFSMDEAAFILSRGASLDSSQQLEDGNTVWFFPDTTEVQALASAWREFADEAGRTRRFLSERARLISISKAARNEQRAAKASQP